MLQSKKSVQAVSDHPHNPKARQGPGIYSVQFSSTAQPASQLLGGSVC